MESAAIDVVDKGWRSVGPFVVPHVMANAASCLVSMETGARGPVMTSSAACASGHYSIIEAYHYLKRGEADVMIAGGTESALSELVMAAFARMGPLSRRNDDPEHASRPFSIDRDGFVSGEGSAHSSWRPEEHRAGAVHESMPRSWAAHSQRTHSTLRRRILKATALRVPWRMLCNMPAYGLRILA